MISFKYSVVLSRLEERLIAGTGLHLWSQDSGRLFRAGAHSRIRRCERVRRTKSFMQSHSIATPHLLTGHLEHYQLLAKLSKTNDEIYYDLFILLSSTIFEMPVCEQVSATKLITG